MTSDGRQVLERVKEQVPPPGPAFRRLEERRARKALRARVEATIVGGAVAIALVAGAVSVIGDDGRRDRPGGEPDVRLVAAPGEYYYVRYVNFDRDGEGQSDGDWRTSTVQIWYGPDESGRGVFGSGDAEPDEQRFAPGELPWKVQPELSTDPGALLDQLIQRGSPSGASPNPIATTSPGRSQDVTSLLRTLQDLLSMGEQFLSPEQVAALSVAAQGIEGVQTETGVLDPLGRPSFRLSFTIDYNIGSGSRIEWYFDERSGQFLGEIWVDQGNGRVVNAQLMQAAGITTSLEEPPSPANRFFTTELGEPAFLAA